MFPACPNRRPHTCCGLSSDAEPLPRGSPSHLRGQQQQLQQQQQQQAVSLSLCLVRTSSSSNASNKSPHAPVTEHLVK
ncbi:hypothetical protein Emed_007003 [Eimeria media]